MGYSESEVETVAAAL
jgi:hypothetical protein